MSVLAYSVSWVLATIAAAFFWRRESRPWEVTPMEPGEMTLAPEEEQVVTVTIEPPESFVGERSFNINAMHGAALLGGVTLTVTQ